MASRGKWWRFLRIAYRIDAAPRSARFKADLHYAYRFVDRASARRRE